MLGVNTRVCTSSGDDPHRLSEQRLEGLLHVALHRTLSRLQLPAGIVCPYIFKV
jgi:hypothetical protein